MPNYSPEIQPKHYKVSIGFTRCQPVLFTDGWFYSCIPLNSYKTEESSRTREVQWEATIIGLIVLHILGYVKPCNCG
jgi:hypothetical protein